MTLGGERYALHTPGGLWETPGTMRPVDALPPYATGSNLVRARGYLELYDLADGLPDPVPLVYTGSLEAETEAELSLLQREFRRRVRTATAISRDGRNVTGVQSGSLVFVSDAEGSQRCTFTLTLIPFSVPDPDDLGANDW